VSSWDNDVNHYVIIQLLVSTSSKRREQKLPYRGSRWLPVIRTLRDVIDKHTSQIKYAVCSVTKHTHTCTHAHAGTQKFLQGKLWEKTYGGGKREDKKQGLARTHKTKQRTSEISGCKKRGKLILYILGDTGQAIISVKLWNLTG
jgi:hypothetical protein